MKTTHILRTLTALSLLLGTSRAAEVGILDKATVTTMESSDKLLINDSATLRQITLANFKIALDLTTSIEAVLALNAYIAYVDHFSLGANNGGHELIIAPGSTQTADRTLTLSTADADRTLTINGNATLVAGTMAALVAVPTIASSSGTAGQIAYDASFFYVCVATNTWRRAALSSW